MVLRPTASLRVFEGQSGEKKEKKTFPVEPSGGQRGERERERLDIWICRLTFKLLNGGGGGDGCLFVCFFHPKRQKKKKKSHLCAKCFFLSVKRRKDDAGLSERAGRLMLIHKLPCERAPWIPPTPSTPPFPSRLPQHMEAAHKQRFLFL